ncbi:hypothetical protein ACTFIV_009525 [Dictyostelium citrinum]
MRLISVFIFFIYFFNEINGSILSSSSSSTSSSEDYYPIESSGRCADYIGDTNLSNCSIYLPYKRIYISDTFNQTKSLETANQIFPLTYSMGSSCNQPSVFKTLCSYLFPECQLYTNNKVVVAVPVLTCYEECEQSVSFCNAKNFFNCNQSFSESASVPRFPVDSYYYNFEEYQSGILDLKCRNTFNEDSDSRNNNNNTSSDGSNSNNVTPMPTETSSEEHEYNNSHRSLAFKVFITLCITVPIILIIALIWYNFKRRANKLKKLQEQQYNQQQHHTINMENEETPLLK